MTDYEYHQLLNKVAEDAANEKIKYNTKIGAYKHGVPETELAKVTQAYKTELRKKYHRDDDKGLTLLAQFPAVDAMKWLQGYSDVTPEARAKSIEAAKVAPLLASATNKDKSWYDMSSDQLKGYGADMGYDVSSPEGYKSFLDLVGQYQQEADRANLLKEWRDSTGTLNYALNRMLYPSTTQEIENAIATGVGADGANTVNGEDIYGPELTKLKAVDYFTDLAQMAAPSASIVRNPIANGIIDATLQGMAEAARQGAKSAISETDQDFNLGDVALATTLGATKPGLLATASGAVTQVPGKGAKDFARGIVQSTKGADPRTAEREAIKEMLELYLHPEVSATAHTSSVPFFHSQPGESITLGSKPRHIPTVVSAADMNKVTDMNKAEDILRALYLDDPENAWMTRFLRSEAETPRAEKLIQNWRNGKLTEDDAKGVIESVLGEYDRPVGYKVIYKDGEFRVAHPGENIPMEATGEPPAYKIVVTDLPEKEVEQMYSSSPYNAFSVPSKAMFDMVFPSGQKISLKTMADAARRHAGVYGDMAPLELPTVQQPAANSRILDSEMAEVFERLFPAKMSYERGANKAANAGRMTGNILGNFGSRVEPTIKANPFSAGTYKQEVDYKSQPWYRKLSKEQQKAFDQAYAAKKEDK